MKRTPYDVILKPVISERSMADAQNKKYTFKVAVGANRTEVKAAVEDLRCRGQECKHNECKRQS